MTYQSKVLNVAIVGGGPGCKAIMDMIFAERLSQLRMKLLGLACTNPKAVGYRYARKKGVYTTRGYRDLYKLKDLNMIIELTGREEVAVEIARTKPNHVRFMDHVAAHLFWDIFRIEEKRIAERKQAAEATKLAYAELNQIFETAADAMCVIAMDFNVIRVNNTFSALSGVSKEQTIGKKCHEVFPCSMCNSPDCPLTRIPGGEERVEREVEKERKDGTRIPCILVATPFRDPGGELIGIVECFKDITEHKRAEDEKAKLEVHLSHAQRMEAIGTLSGGIAHDFNNLLMSIQGNISLMLMDLDSTHPYYKRLKSIEDQVQSGAKLTSHLLGYARKGRYQVNPINLNNLLKETSETFGRTRKEITIHIDLAENLFAVEADKGQIEQVVLNLYLNAADAMRVGGNLFLKSMNVTHEDIRCKLYDPKPGNYVLLTVADTGTGMDEETMGRIFVPFFTTKEMGQGTGLGLASAYGIIKGHGGYIDVASEKGHGTTFRIYLPATGKKVENTVYATEQIIEGSGTILLVDDETIVLDIGVEMLERLGYTVLQAKGGREATETYKQNHDKIDMVILDMIMPGMGGSETYDKITEINPNVKVLLSSGYSIDGQAKEILARGCDGFIQKPFTTNELSQSISEVLSSLR